MNTSPCYPYSSGACDRGWFIDYEGYYVADLQCHDYKPKGADDPADVENWVLSANDYQMVRPDDPGHEIQMQMAYNTFKTVVSAHDHGTDTILKAGPLCFPSQRQCLGGRMPSIISILVLNGVPIAHMHRSCWLFSLLLFPSPY